MIILLFSKINPELKKKFKIKLQAIRKAKIGEYIISKSMAHG